jgi:hypothetical protein
MGPAPFLEKPAESGLTSGGVDMPAVQLRVNEKPMGVGMPFRPTGLVLLQANEENSLFIFPGVIP